VDYKDQYRTPDQKVRGQIKVGVEHPDEKDRYRTYEANFNRNLFDLLDLKRRQCVMTHLKRQSKKISAVY